MFHETAWSAVLFLWRLAQKLENVMLVSRRREQFRIFLHFILQLNSLKREVLEYTRIYLLFVTWRRATSSYVPCKQSNLGAWSLWNWHSTQTRLWGRRCVFWKQSSMCSNRILSIDSSEYSFQQSSWAIVYGVTKAASIFSGAHKDITFISQRHEAREANGMFCNGTGIWDEPSQKMSS